MDGIRDQRQAAGKYPSDNLRDRQEAVCPDGNGNPPVAFFRLHMGMIMRHEKPPHGRGLAG